MRRVLTVVYALAVGLGIGTLTGCKRSIEIQVVPGFNKPVPVLEKGDVITWKTADGYDMKVQFTPFSPCEESDNPTATCHVKVNSGMFPYVCDQCDDPVVPVKSSIGVLGKFQTTGTRAKTSGNPAYVGVYCDAQNAAMAVPETASPGMQFQWIPAGEKPSENWSVTVNGGTCNGTNQFGTGTKNLICTVLTGAKSQDYKVHVNGCTDGTAHLTIQ